jgi:hypothetical protein
MLMSQKVTSPPTQAQTIRGRKGRRRDASRRSSTTTATPPHLHQGSTTTTRPQKRKRLIRIILSIILACRTIQMLIYCPFLLVNPHFDGDDYSFWSHKMHSHLFSLHPSIWEIIENGMRFDSSDNPVFINEQIHKNAQANIVLLASLCRDEYNKVSGWTMPSKYGIPSKSLMRVTPPP